MKAPSHEEFADRFNHLLESLFREVDQVALKKEIDNLLARRPDVPREKLAKRLIDRAAISTAVVGAGAGAPGGALGLLAMAPDIFNLVRQQSRLVLSIAFLYGQEPGLGERFKEVLATLAVSTGASASRQGVRYLVKRGLEADAARAIVRRIAGRFVARKLPDIAPVVGGIAGAGLNYLAVQATGRVAVEYYARLEKMKGEKAPAEKKATAPNASKPRARSAPAKSKTSTSATPSGPTARRAATKTPRAATKGAATRSTSKRPAGKKAPSRKRTAKRSTPPRPPSTEPSPDSKKS